MLRAVSGQLSLLALLCLAAPPRRSEAQVLRFAELTAAQIARLDRAHTVVIVPGGIIEEHGPGLPVDADGMRNRRLADDIARAIAGRPGWTAVVFPFVPLGNGPFNIVAGRPSFPGSVPVRASTLRAVFMDLADALGGQGFRKILVVHGHGDPNHNRMLDLAGDYFHATYGGFMVHLLGRQGCQAESVGGPPASLFDTTALRLDAGSPHAGALESARTLFLRPDLVRRDRLRALPDVTAGGMDAWRAAASDSTWPGYVGAPRFATRPLGQWVYARERAACTALAERIVDVGDDPAAARYADEMLAIPPLRAEEDSALAAEAAVGRRQDEWLRSGARR